jgi:hypothetical protein
MIADIAKVIQRTEFYILALIIAAGAIYYAFFENLPTGSNDFTPVPRTSPIYLLLVAGGCILLASVGTFVLVKRMPKKSETTMDEKEKVPTRIEAPTPHHDDFRTRSDVESGLLGSPNNPAKHLEQLRVIYAGLSRSQQRIVTHICYLPQSQMPIDVFFDSFVKRYGPTFVANVSEMFFRIEVLSLKGMCQLKKIGPGASIVMLIPETATLLRDNDILSS